VSAEAIAAVTAAFDAAGHGDADALPALCADSVIWRGSPSWGAAYCCNREDLRAWLRRVREVIGVERFQATDLAWSLAADQVVVHLRWFFPITRTTATST
jgi:ketosteroid isomerase-like protein